MASQSLYRKWRSQKFGELIGQEPIIRTLKNALSSGKPAHAYLFTGPRGTGKTSTARLLAKTINCTNPRDGEPCNECQQCREITAGNSFNVIEIDAASNRGIDSIRDLREKVMMPPSTGKYKVYVLDEAHMLTTEAFNALLKTLEEPPNYAIFVLATTDVHKMLPTVLSRCQRFDFKRITTRQIVEHLNFVAEQEHIKLERAAAELIARAAAGGMRDALSLLDQAIAYCGEEISLAQVQTMLGVADPRAIHKLIMHVADLDSSGGLHQIHELAEAGADLRQVNAQMIEYWRALMLARAGADVATILDLAEDEIRDVMQTSRLFELEELTECARVFAQNDLMQKNQGTPQLGLELAFLQCVELHRHPHTSQSIVVAPASTLPSRTMTSHAQPQPQPRSAVPYSPPARPPAPPRRAVEAMPALPPDWDDIPPLVEDFDTPEPAPVVSMPAARDAQAEAPTPMPAAPQHDAGPPPLTMQQVKSGWENVMKRVKQRKQSATTAAMLKFYDIVGVEGTAEQVIISIQAQKQGYYSYVNDQERYKDVEWALMMEFGRPCKVRLLPPGQPLPAAPVSSSWEIGSQSTSVAPAGTPQQSAHLERPASQPPTLSNQGPSEVPTGRVQEEHLAYTDSSSASLARMDRVSENTTMVSPPETIEQRARRDPIVEEVVKTFNARIVSVQPK